MNIKHVNSDSIRSERNCSYIEYIARRICSSLLYFRIYRKIYPNDPYYTPKAIKKAIKLLNKNSKVFEWGSGMSTIWYANRVKEVVAIEHNKEWYNKGLQGLANSKLNNTNIFLVPTIADNDTFSWEKDWKHYETLNHPPKNPEFIDYIHKIDEYPDSYFDCIAIDGRERVGCSVHAISKLAKNGFIILDDSHREKYTEIFEILSDWNAVKFNFGLLQTTIFTRNQ